MQTFETAKGLCMSTVEVKREECADEVAEQRSGDLTELHNALDGSFNNAPSQLDAEP
jgi:hypothetical protein